jgi:hypothetical protein
MRTFYLFAFALAAGTIASTRAVSDVARDALVALCDSEYPTALKL